MKAAKITASPLQDFILCNCLRNQNGCFPFLVYFYFISFSKAHHIAFQNSFASYFLMFSIFVAKTSFNAQIATRFGSLGS